jgi:hypothetical protein
VIMQSKRCLLMQDIKMKRRTYENRFRHIRSRK